ncbi:MAG: hypothetical protein M1812_005792 [Candelaria pacifica]|nr:MAG: hypothetical protein M1812_005792 [Candelaria pacifica]
MEYPCITLHTKERTTFLWGEGFEGVTDVELETLLQKSRDTLISVEAEVEKRSLSKASNQPSGIDRYSDSLRKGVNRIQVLERLDDKAAEHVKAAVEILTAPQTVRSFKVYRAFLHDVLHHCGPELVLLCAACLGKPKVASLKVEDRIRLLDHVKGRRSSYNSPILGRLATEYGVHSLQGEQEKKRRRVESTSLTSEMTTNESAPARITSEGDYTVDSTRVGGASYSHPRFRSLELMQI